MADKIPTWDESSPIEGNAVPTWEESKPVETRMFSPTKNNWRALRNAFSGDPLAFIDDPEIKADLNFATGRLENPELERKKWALAAYFAQMRKEDIQFCHGNIDTLISAWNNGEKMSVDAAYNDVAAAIGVREFDNKGFWESRPVAALVEGSGEVAKGVFNTLGFLAKIWAAGTAAELKAEALASKNPEVAELYRDPDEAGKLAEGGVRGVYKKHYEPIRAWGEENMQLPANWMTNSDSFGDWCGNAAISIVNYLPQLAAQTGLTVATGGTSGLAIVYGINGYYEIIDDHPEMTEEQAVIYGVGIGLINGVLEKVTLGIIEGKVSKEVAKQGIKKGLLQAFKHFGWAAVKEGGEEGLEELAENLLDIAMGLRGDTKNWKASDYWREMRRNVPEAAFLGGLTGAPLATDSYVSLREVAKQQETMRRMVHDKVEELSGKENLSPEEAAELEKLKVVDDAGNTADVAAAAQEIYQREVIRQREAAERDAEMTDEERLQKESSEAQQFFRLRRQLQHNPEETIDAANELIRQFPNFDLNVVYSAEELPAEVLVRIEEDGLDASLIRAWVDDSDVIHLVASNVRPSEVARTLGHEIVGHKGLRTVFGDKFDSLLDQVYRDHFEEIQKLENVYKRDTETVENQRYLTEEFLAECADAKVKPSWWKEFLGFIRQQLRKILPKMHFTDADIEAALSRSARAMRRRAAAQTDMGVRFAMDQESGKAFPLRTENTYTAVFDVLKAMQGKIFHNADYQIDARLSSTGVTKLLSNKAREKSMANGFTDAQHLQAAANIDRLFENGVLIEDRPDRNNDPNLKSIKRFAAPFFTGGDFAEARITLKESIEAGHRIYSLELDEIRKPSSPDKGGLDNQANTPALDGYNKLLQKIEKARELLKNNPENSGSELRFSIAPVFTGSAADYDKPSLNYVGTGEGAQVYGWGLYGSSSEKVARWYAEVDAERKNHPRIFFDGEEFNPDWYKRDDVYVTKEPTEYELRNTVLEDVFRREGSWHGALSYYRIMESKARDGMAKEPPEYYVALQDWIQKNHDRIQYKPKVENELVINGEKFVKGDYVGGADWQRIMVNYLFSDKGDVKKALGKVRQSIKKEVELLKNSGSDSDTFYHRQMISDLKKVQDFLSDTSNKITYDDGVSGRRNLYQQTFWPDKQENLLDWDKNITDEQAQQILDRLAEEGGKEAVAFVNRERDDWNDDYGTKGGLEPEPEYYAPDVLRDYLDRFLDFYEADGKYVYHQLTDVFGSPKAASEFLHRAGIDGVTYIGMDSGRRNYVAFSDQDIRVDNHIRFSIAPENENLVVLHNLSAAKLRRAVKLGGLPVPSLAIVDAEKSDFSNFGEISLVADKNLIDPKRKGNKVFNADAYSPRAPQTKKFYSDADYDRAAKVLKPYDLDPDDDKSVASIMEKYKDGMYDSDLEYKLSETYAVLNWYCQDHGIETPAADNWKEVIHIQSSSEFSQWWEDTALPQIGLDPEEKMYAGTTSMGRPRWIPLTLENVVKAMTKKTRNGEGFNYGIGNIRSMKAVQFKSIAQIQSQRDHIVSEEDFKVLKKEIQDEFSELCDRMRAASGSNYGWEYNTGEDCLMAMAEGGRENAEYLHDRFGDNQELFREMAKFLDKLVNMPTEYFEAKPQRAVGLEEFKAAVIPEDTPADVRQMLEDAGVAIYPYSERQDRKAALQMATRDNDLRFSMGVYSEADQRDIITILKPYTGHYAERTAEEYAAYLAERGVNIPPKDAWSFALEACRENMADARKRGIQRRNNWLYDNFPFYREAVDFCGEDFTIKPAHRFVGESFTGAWISPEFVKYSEKRPQGKKESDASYRKYLAKREKALANATGQASDELAEAIARKWGRDALDVEQEMLDFFRDLSKKDFYHQYTEWKQENVFNDKEEQKRAYDEWMKQEQARIENEVVALLEKGQPITEDWIWDNRKVYNELYKQLFSGKEAPYSPGKKDLEAINAALMQEGANASTYAEAYKAAREKAYGEFMSRLAAFRDRVMQSKADAVKLQREALDFAEKNLPPEHRGEFARNIVSLLEYPTSPSTKYPEGRRMHEFRNLFSRIVKRAGEVRKETGVAAIREMLDAAKIKRNYKGIPTSVLPSEQGKVDRIRQAVNMNLATLLNAIEYNNQEIMNLEDDGEKEGLLEHYLEDNRILEMFGNLERRSPDEVEAAAKELEKIIKGGKSAFREAMAARRAEVDAMRKRAVEDATFGKNRYADRGDAQKHSVYWLKNESLGTLMRIASGQSIQDFDNSIGGELYRHVEDATQTEQTALRHMQQDFDAALRDVAGIGGSRIEAMRKKGRFFRMISEVVEHTGVFKTEYTRQIKTGFADYVSEEGRRGLLKKSIPVEDYEWNGKMRKGARSILRDIDNGGKSAFFDGLPLDDVAVAFLRQQLADFDAGLKQSYEIFNDESDDANFNRMLEEERQAGRLLVFTHLPEEEAHVVEVPLSQGAALQILLTWEQEHYQPNMKWNGWTEESIRQLKKFIEPEVLKMGYWMRDTIARNKAALDQKVFERYGAHLPLNDKYFPAAFRGGKTKAVRVDSELGRGAGAMSINPNFLIARKFHLKPVDMDADAFSSFMSNQIEQSHFLAWSDCIRDLKAVYGGTMVQKAIADNFGRAVVDNLVERVVTIARGGGQFSGDYAARLFSKLYRYWVPAKIAINPSSVIKQMFGAAAYMNHVPVKDFVSYFARANFSNPDYRAFAAWAKNTDYMKNRLAGGLDKDLSYLLNYTRDSKAYSPMSDALLSVGTIGTKWADAWSAMHGGYAAYMYALDQARKSGSSESEAREAARRAWMRATDETQQSGYLKDQNFFQSNQGGFRYLTAFMTNPIQVMNLQLQTINEIRYGSDKKAAWRKLGRQILVNHFIVPTLMQFTTDMLRYGFNVSDWWDEAEFEDYLLAWVLGSFESAFLAGKLVSNIGGYALDRIFSRKQSFGDTVAAVPLAEDLKKDAGLLVKALDGEKELTEKDLMEGVKALGDVGMALGLADRRVGTVGALLHALGAQGKRVIRWFDDDRKRR